MIILPGALAFFAAGLALVAGRGERIKFFLVMLAGFAGYYFTGEPNRQDAPLAGRIQDLQETPANFLTPEEKLAMWRFEAQEQTGDPSPHSKMATLLVQRQEFVRAKRAYRDALRRDERHVPSLRGLADLSVRAEKGQVGLHAASLYRVAAELQDAHSIFMLGLYHWQAGQEQKAESLWDRAMGLLAPGSVQRQELANLRSSIESSPESFSIKRQ